MINHSGLGLCIFATVQNIASSDISESSLCLPALFFIDQVAVLIRDGFLTMLDFIDITAVFLCVIYHHVKLACCKLQLKHTTVMSGCFHGF